MSPTKIHRIRFPYVGPLALSVWRDPGEAKVASGVILGTNLRVKHYRQGRLIDDRDLGSGVVTATFVNALVSTAVTPATTPLATFKYHSTGTGTTAATDDQTALVTPIALTRPAGTITNAQTATGGGGGNHTALLENQAAITYDAGYAVTEWGIFDALTTGNMADRRVFAAMNVVNTDVLTWTWQVTLPSNG